MWLLTLLAALLPLLLKLLEWLQETQTKGRQLSARQVQKVDEVVWCCDRIARLAPAVGCTRGGVPPEGV